MASMQPSHPWKARLIVGVIMLILAFIGIAVTDIRTVGGWDYWKWMVLIYGVLAMWLSWYVKRKLQTVSPIAFWHELLHWLALAAAVFLVSYLVHVGTFSRFIAGIFQLILLSLAVFLAGIYIEATFMAIGVVLGIFALLTAMLAQYVYFIVVPLVVAAIAINVIMVWISHKKYLSKKDR